MLQRPTTEDEGGDVMKNAGVNSFNSDDNMTVDDPNEPLSVPVINGNGNAESGNTRKRKTADIFLKVLKDSNFWQL